MEKEHKPNCAIYQMCAVYHSDGKCPGYKNCDCGFQDENKTCGYPVDLSQEQVLKTISFKKYGVCAEKLPCKLHIEKKCEQCLANYTREHICPPWLKALKKRYDMKKENKSQDCACHCPLTKSQFDDKEIVHTKEKCFVKDIIKPEEFDNKVIELLEMYNLYRGTMTRKPYLKLEVENSTLDNLKSFIRQQIKEAEQRGYEKGLNELLEEKNKMKFIKDEKSDKWNNYDSTMSDDGYPIGYNQALTDIEDLIKKLL